MKHPLVGITKGQEVITFVQVGCSPMKATWKSSRGEAQADRICSILFGRSLLSENTAYDFIWSLCKQFKCLRWVYHNVAALREVDHLL